eukprot:TRINITY_DN67240_c13_g3_i1.p1 TRINITY_DN67240_c13_g3~~TRINITY_DN67240_c13_g3_i1.p1  ORF type:complete len:286 (-),score=15.88 TRINITY_DN67240_c13_g3_i1:1177-2034(-)
MIATTPPFTQGCDTDPFSLDLLRELDSLNPFDLVELKVSQLVAARKQLAAQQQQRRDQPAYTQQTEKDGAADASSPSSSVTCAGTLIDPEQSSAVDTHTHTHSAKCATTACSCCAAITVEATPENAALMLHGVISEEHRTLIQTYETKVLKLYYDHLKPDGLDGCIVFTPLMKNKQHPAKSYLLSVKEGSAADLVIDRLPQRQQLERETGIRSVRVVIKRYINSYVDSVVYLLPVMSQTGVVLRDPCGGFVFPEPVVVELIASSVKEKYQHLPSQLLKDPSLFLN